MARKIILGRRNWVREPGVAWIELGGAWSLPLSNMATIRPQEVAQAGSTAIADTKWRVDLGAQRRIGAVSLANLRTTTSGLIKVAITTDGTTSVYDSGTVSSWPTESTSGGSWGVTVGPGVYNAEFYRALGYPRIFIPSAIVTGRYVDVFVEDTGATSNLQVGVMGVWEIWEPPRNIARNWSMTTIDESEERRVPGGSSYILERPRRRRLNLGFGHMPEAEFLARQLDWTLTVGRSWPVIAIPFPEAGGSIEKTAIYGGVSQDSQIVNPFYAYYAQTLTIDQWV